MILFSRACLCVHGSFPKVEDNGVIGSVSTESVGNGSGVEDSGVRPDEGEVEEQYKEDIEVDSGLDDNSKAEDDDDSKEEELINDTDSKAGTD